MTIFLPAAASQEKNDNFEAISLYNKAVDEAVAGNFEESANLTERALAIQPNFTLALVTRTGSLLELGRINEAEKSLDKALSLDPENPAVLTSAASVRLKTREYNESLRFAEKALEKDPSLIEAWIIKGTASGGLGDYSGEIKASEKALAIDPKNDLAMQNLQYAQTRLKGDQKQRTPIGALIAVSALLFAGLLSRK